MRAPSPPLPALEIPVRCRGAALARPEDVLVHAEAHRAARIAPLESGLAEDAVEPFALGLRLHPLRARAPPSRARRSRLVDPAPPWRPRADPRSGALVHEPEEHPIHRKPFERRAGPRPMYSSARAYDCRSASDGASAGSGTRSVMSAVMPGLVPQVTCGPSAPASIVDRRGRTARRDRCASRLPAVDCAVPCVARRRAGPASQVRERGLVRRDHPGPRARPRWTCCRPSSVLPSRGRGWPRRCTRCTWPVAPAVPIRRISARTRSLAADPGRRPAREPDLHRPGPRLHDALGGQHVLHLAGADAERQRAERAVGGGVRVAADDDHAGLGEPELRADHVHDALLRASRGRTARRPNSRAFRTSVADLRGPRSGRRWAAAGRRWGRCGPPWPRVRSGRRTRRPASRSPSNAWGEVTSWTRCRST